MIPRVAGAGHPPSHLLQADMKRHAASWFGSLAIHGAILGSLSASVVAIPVQMNFQRGRTAIELQASIAAAPRAETETTPTTKITPTPVVEVTKPIELQATEIVVERKPAKPPEQIKLVDASLEKSDPLLDELALAEPMESRPEPTEKPIEEKVEPPSRKQNEAKPRVVESPVESVASAASKADSGAEVDHLPHPHPLNRQPPYPPDAYARKQQGTVVLHLHVTTAGTVGDVQVVRSSGVMSLDEAAVEAARAWRYTPARKQGLSVAMVFETHINFSFRS